MKFRHASYVGFFPFKQGRSLFLEELKMRRCVEVGQTQSGDRGLGGGDREHKKSLRP